MIVDALWFRILGGLLIGAALGSFTTMLAYRLPRRLSIVHPPSTCPSCCARLGVRDLLPIFSWLLSGGRCRHCSAPIGARYLVIELIVTAFSICAFVFVGYDIMLIPVLAIIIGCLTFIVVRQH
jgi:leader peptidase (prepilin peptidase)/N-methyltransferase